MSIKKITFLEIFILVVAIFAFAWMVNTEVEVVSAATGDYCTSGGSEGTCMNPSLCTNIIIPGGYCDGYPDEVCCSNPSSSDGDPPENDGNGFIEEALPVAAVGFGKKIWKWIFRGGSDPVAIAEAKEEVLALVRAGRHQEAEALAQSSGIDKAASGTLKEFLGGPWGKAVQNAAYAVAVAAVITYFANRYASERNAQGLTTTTWIGAGIGIAGTTIWAGIAAGLGAAGPPVWIAAAVVAVFAGIYMLVGYQLYSRHIFTFYPTMWQAPLENYNCNSCNRLQLNGEGICSEYLCHSYGVACEWVNDETDYETCTEMGQGDRIPPVITPLREVYGEPVFSSEEFRYSATSAGARIIFDDPDTQGCVPPFTPLMIAFETNENAHCKIGLEPNTERTPEEAFAVMKNLAEGPVFTTNHTLLLPSSVTASQISQEIVGYTLTNGGNYGFYIRCKDATRNGNINDFDYVFEFCVHDIDMWPPEITGTSPESDSFIPYNVDRIESFEVYTDEPVICKWDFEQRAFNFMRYDFDYCSQNINDPIRSFRYGCRGTLNGFVPEQDNTYYIACMDLPGLIGTAKEDQRNTGDAVPILLKGSQELIIQGVAINEQENNSVIKDSIEPVNVNLEVLTFGGAEEGKAKCQHSNTGTQENDYAFFYNEGSAEYLTTNTQSLYLVEGTYKYYIRCEDAAGNIATSMVNFSVEIDTDSPEIVRIYKQGNELRLITDEESTCYYNTFSCIYDIEQDGIEMSSGDGKAHSVEWNIENDLHIKCKDMYGGRPDMDKCSIVARPFEVIEVI